MTNKNEIDHIAILKNLSARDFIAFGLGDVAYIRPLFSQNRTVFAVHGADGRRLSVMNSLSEAVMAARHHDLEPVTLH